MKSCLYAKLALTGIKKNSRLYLPYILTCTGMVMMFYVILYINSNSLLERINGGRDLILVLDMGEKVIGVFAAIFLFYTNSFLIKRRYREFGLYNILGMGKKGINRIIIWEAVLTAIISLTAGGFLGILLSKLAELGLVNIIREDTTFDFSISFSSLKKTCVVFCVIFLIIMIKALIDVRKSKPIELMKSESYGEKPPKANWLLAFAGVLILGFAYFIAIRIDNPIGAVAMFMVAVIMVIAATYMLFTAGSVAMCRILQKNRNYYYRKNHFVSVSSMVFRMKRNGAGLASICILSTMVLVMIASTTSLYICEKDIIKTRYSEEAEFLFSLPSADSINSEYQEAIKKSFDDVFIQNGIAPEKVVSYNYSVISGLSKGSEMLVDSSQVNTEIFSIDMLRVLFFIDQDEYNRNASEKAELTGNDVLICPTRCTYDEAEINIGGTSFRVVGKTEQQYEISEAISTVFSSILIVVSDYDVLKPVNQIIDSEGRKMLSNKWYYSYDTGVDNEEKQLIFGQLRKAASEASANSGITYTSGSRLTDEQSFFRLFGALFFIAILLSLIFIFAAILIIYYKQVSEGYEDQKRFEIMKKVGMTSKDIKRSVNSQVLTVFSLPIIAAGMHLAFAFPMIWRILQLFGLRNMGLAIKVTISAYLIFTVFYALIYRMTAKAYYNIVNDPEK